MEDYLSSILKYYYPPTKARNPISQLHQIITHGVTPGATVSIGFGSMIGFFLLVAAFLFFSGA
jgi:hypothetical protein